MKRWLAAALFLFTGAAHADPIVVERPPVVELHGYIQPQLGVLHRPDALLRDRWTYGGLSSRAGIVISGTPVPTFSYVLHLSVDARSLLVITGVDSIDTNGDGSIDSLSISRRPTVGTLFEEVSLRWQPRSYLGVKMGAMRMPFTLSLGTTNQQLLFANRPGATEVFQSGSDQGIVAMGDWLDGKVEASAGLFTGSSLNLLPPNTDARGLVYALRIDGNPLGRLPKTGTDFHRGGLRFGLGVGMLYRSGTLFSDSGYELADLRDARVSASVRVAFRGLVVQAEGIRRLATDNVSSRPNQATGAYVQGSYFFLVNDETGLSPVARAGLSRTEERTAPHATETFEGGLAVFPRADMIHPEGVRFLLQYSYERRVVENERAHGLVLQGQLLF